MTTVSIALATFNGQRYLRTQLDSLANQTAPPSELVVADDGSSDDTMMIITEFARTAPFPVRIIQNDTRLGYRANFMNAAAVCTSDLIAFCDQDDIWDQNKLIIMRRAFDEADVLLAYHNSNLIDKSGATTGTIFSKWIRSKTFNPLTINPWIIIPGHAQVLRQSLIRFTPLHSKSIDPYCPDERMPHDSWYPFWASALGKIAYVSESLVGYRQHGANTSGWPGNWLAFLSDHITNAERYVKGNTIGAKNRLELLNGSQDIARANELVRINAAISYYEALLICSTQRAQIYSAERLGNRAQVLHSLLRQGAYTTDTPDRLGLDALLLDTFIGVLFSRIGRMRPRLD